ncbi:SatD family protein [Halobacterium jilantaiense]|uniref:SatD family (SatD) n=1 Tax=Halobacterium jilantaiense TaxID=355548 RepID=A0A1I0PWB0_9EURY|nr:SatD family protein [Halobacterium jilantaiense]SEW18679.1 SatD family (SatD) [Halobacterium jilantaiense]
MSPSESSGSYVVVGDVVGSRAIDDRDTFGRALDDALATVNHQYAGSVRADVVTVKGVDEVAGVLDHPRDVYGVVKTVHDEIHPDQVRFGVAHGAIDVNPDSADVTTMDGPAFHHANELLEWVERRGSLFAFEGRYPAVDGLVSSTVNLILTLREDWTDPQFEAVRARERASSQQEAADQLDIGQQTVSDRLQRAHWNRVTQAEDTVREILAGYEDGS